MLEQLRNFYKDGKNDKDFKRARWSTIEEVELLHNLVSYGLVQQVVEIGTANGWSSCWMAAAGVDVLTCDIVDRSKVWNIERFKHIKNNITFIQDSINNVNLSCTLNKKTLFFLDGDHTQEGVEKDLNIILPALKDTDLLVLHDVGCEKSVERWWKRLQKEHSDYKFSFYDTYHGIGIMYK